VNIRTDLAGELFSTVGQFRRQVRRSGGRPVIGTGLPESQAELLRLVGRHPDISVRKAAAELGLAANTASTLVSRLSADGLLVRTVDPDDRRVGRLRLTESAQRIADESAPPAAPHSPRCSNASTPTRSTDLPTALRCWPT
jgi:DNA-binding MarR family transcriptional regulator